MIQKNKFGKEAVKNAKKAWQQRSKSQFGILLDEPVQRLGIKITPVSNMILTGIVDGEKILEDDYPVYSGYTYVIDDNGGQVVISFIQGTIKDLKRDIRNTSNYSVNNIYNCHRKNRNIK